ncbi:ImmA/IrrE family metallo-endopeptidase [Periweissella beninensis]|uniref:ImmA/IrrE family metallo-endopeptidase n=1 Tax=Periweissella beninensis TaxID=504936 RepID=A0ABT0VHI6_9LACO|nr:ImmA/IrrE family metallo-endopeptidase [Periweissella beninensis]MBM7544826.1 Zn-dependent peptidase ImmA (M78 family) [Periweissella beninensis]MCM2437075.1 ImmA/IrrE family metallo-endopeptidase [Periweissella beninensis]MCT4396666.1 ImmA/IrrE family metallo-endopeptidase [Periweissella beninensis]
MLSYLLKTAKAHHINLYFTDDLPKHISAFADQKSQSIVINNTLANCGATYYKIAHEIGHLITDNHPVNYKLRYNQLKNEQIAHQLALNLLLPFYLSQKTPEDVNLHQLMRYFDIPTSLTGTVSKFVTNYFTLTAN